MKLGEGRVYGSQFGAYSGSCFFAACRVDVQSGVRRDVYHSGAQSGLPFNVAFIRIDPAL